MEHDTLVANAINQLVDCNYALHDPQNGYDCLNYLFVFYEAFGIKLPTEFEGYKKEDYAEIWNKDYKKALSILSRWYRTLGIKVDFSQIKRGDLLLFDVDAMGEMGTATGIYLGNGNMFMIFGKHGGRIIPLNDIKKLLLTEVRRIII